MNRYLAQILVFLVTISTAGWSIYCVLTPGLGKRYTTSVQLKNYLESCPAGVSFLLGGFIVWTIWEAFRKRDDKEFGLVGYQFWLIVIPAYLLGHALWSI